jgi:site-specific recombinase XerC
MRIHTAASRYVRQLRADGRSPHTIAQVSRHVGVLARWLVAHRLPTDVRRVTHEHIARFLVSRDATCRPDGELKKATATNALRSSLRTFFTYVHAAGYAPRNAAALVRRAKCATPPPRALPEGDCRRLLATLAASDDEHAARDHLLFRLLVETGLRIGSALALEVRDVDLAASELTLRRMKGDRPDRVAVPKGLRGQLRAYLRGRDEGALFLGRDGRPMTARHARRRLAVWLRRAGVERHASPHALRHSFAAAAYRRTRDIVAVQRLLRHRAAVSTMVYARSAATADSHGLR